VGQILDPIAQPIDDVIEPVAPSVTPILGPLADDQDASAEAVVDQARPPTPLGSISELSETLPHQADSLPSSETPSVLSDPSASLSDRTAASGQGTEPLEFLLSQTAPPPDTPGSIVQSVGAPAPLAPTWPAFDDWPVLDPLSRTGNVLATEPAVAFEPVAARPDESSAGRAVSAPFGTHDAGIQAVAPSALTGAPSLSSSGLNGFGPGLGLSGMSPQPVWDLAQPVNQPGSGQPPGESPAAAPLGLSSGSAGGGASNTSLVGGGTSSAGAVVLLTALLLIVARRALERLKLLLPTGIVLSSLTPPA
jgi:hypothetical protein